MLVAWMRTARPSKLVVALTAAAITLTAAGCGAAESSDPEVTLRLTRDFGRTLLAEETLPLEGHRTALRLLRESHDVDVSEHGSVEAIDGLRARRATRPGGDDRTWALNLNGIEDDLGARDLPLSPGSVVQFDYRDWYVTLDVRATVGAFPQPFTGGMLGARFPTTVHCAPGYDRACREVRQALRDAGVDPDGAKPRPRVLPGARRFPGTTRQADVLVGTWSHWRGRRWPRQVDRGARYSGVFARFGPDAKSLRLLDWDDNVAGRLGPGAGLVAAMRPTAYDLVWFVTGTDREGVRLAAEAVEPDALRDAFSVAVTADGVQKLPLPPAEGEAAIASEAPPNAGPLLVRAADPRAPHDNGDLYELSPGAPARRFGKLGCARVHASPDGPALCISLTANAYDYEAVILDRHGEARERFAVEGFPSRVRVSADGRYGAYTMFEEQHQSYLPDTDEFSTTTAIVDMATGRELLALDDYRMTIDGEPGPPAGELWGVTFGDRGRFYATFAKGRQHLLIEGRVGSYRARVVGSNVECPSLSPDGARIAYKRRIGNSNRWRLHVRDVDGGHDRALAETDSVDDQPEWLGNGLIAYSKEGAVYAVRADGRGSPMPVADRAASPASLVP